MGRKGTESRPFLRRMGQIQGLSVLPMATTVLAGEAGRLITRFTETGTVRSE